VSQPTDTHHQVLPRFGFHRSACFYLGFFPIVILLWIWADSVRNHTNWHHARANDGTLCLIAVNSTFRIERITRKPDYDGVVTRNIPFYGGIYRFGAAANDSEGKPMPIFPPIDWHDEKATNRAPGFHVETLLTPIWLVLAAYLPLWLGLSYLLARSKQRKLIAALPPPQAHTD
jgi:hypothetical protein